MMRIICLATGAVLEAEDAIARGYLQNPSFVPAPEGDQKEKTAPDAKPEKRGGKEN